MTGTRNTDPDVLNRRDFVRHVSRRSAGVVLGGMATPALLAACATDTTNGTEAIDPADQPEDEVAGQALIGDVLDFALTSDDWAGDFGFVALRLHHGLFEGGDVYFVRTDASDLDFATGEGLLWVPKIAPLQGRRLSGDIFLFEDEDHPAVLSSEPGRPDYTPAWRVHRVSNSRGRMGSVDEVRSAEQRGELEIRRTDVVVNFPVVKWSAGELPVDDELTDYLGPGQLTEAPDTDAMRVGFKLHECFPQARYIVTDTALEPMAEGMHVAHSPRLAASSGADATGRTNVFMNGIAGPGPMDGQPSVFDSLAGDEEWSPYWDHMTYVWEENTEPRLLTTEEEIHEARDAGELEEFPGTPETEGETFAVNCPVPVLAPNTFTA